MAAEPLCTCLGDSTKITGNLCHLPGCARYLLDVQCAQCTRLMLRNENDPPCMVDDGIAMLWCSSECADAWMNDPVYPKRKEGWISVSDLTPEQLNEMLGDIGLGLDGVGERKPS